MPRAATLFACQHCGYSAQKWLGRCPGCGEWNSFVQEVVRPSVGSAGARMGATAAGPVSLPTIDLSEHPRYPTGVSELDRVLGGGLVPGGMVLIGGDPGIG